MASRDIKQCLEIAKKQGKQKVFYINSGQSMFAKYSAFSDIMDPHVQYAYPEVLNAVGYIINSANNQMLSLESEHKNTLSSVIDLAYAVHYTEDKVVLVNELTDTISKYEIISPEAQQKSTTSADNENSVVNKLKTDAQNAVQEGLKRLANNLDKTADALLDVIFSNPSCCLIKYISFWGFYITAYKNYYSQIFNNYSNEESYKRFEDYVETTINTWTSQYNNLPLIKMLKDNKESIYKFLDDTATTLDVLEATYANMYVLWNATGDFFRNITKNPDPMSAVLEGLVQMLFAYIMVSILGLILHGVDTIADNINEGLEANEYLKEYIKDLHKFMYIFTAFYGDTYSKEALMSLFDVNKFIDESQILSSLFERFASKELNIENTTSPFVQPYKSFVSALLKNKPKLPRPFKKIAESAAAVQETLISAKQEMVETGKMPDVDKLITKIANELLMDSTGVGESFLLIKELFQGALNSDLSAMTKAITKYGPKILQGKNKHLASLLLHDSTVIFMGLLMQQIAYLGEKYRQALANYIKNTYGENPSLEPSTADYYVYYLLKYAVETPVIKQKKLKQTCGTLYTMTMQGAMFLDPTIWTYIVAQIVKELIKPLFMSMFSQMDKIDKMFEELMFELDLQKPRLNLKGYIDGIKKLLDVFYKYIVDTNVIEKYKKCIINTSSLSMTLNKDEKEQLNSLPEFLREPLSAMFDILEKLFSKEE